MSNNVGNRFSPIQNSYKRTTNEEGFAAFNLDEQHKYLQMLMTNVMGDTFYVDADTLVDRALNLHKEMCAHDPRFMVKAIVYARKYGYMRTQPITGLVVLTTGNDAVKRMARYIAPAVLRTPNDLIDFVTLAGHIREGRGLGTSVKTLINVWLNNLTEYQAIKYGGEKEGKLKCRVCGTLHSFNAVKHHLWCPKCGGSDDYDLMTFWSLRDILRASRPIPKDRKQEHLFRYLVHGNYDRNSGKYVDLRVIPQVFHLEALKHCVAVGGDNTDRIIYHIEQGKLPYEVVTGILRENANPRIWEYLMKQMPLFALMRNINTLQRKGVFDASANITYLHSRLTDANAIHKAMILPGQVVNAFSNTIAGPTIQNTLRDMAELAVANTPDIPGKTVVFMDISGSMGPEYKRHGATLGVGLMKASECADMWLFGTQLHYPNISTRDSLITNVESIVLRDGGGTATNFCLEHLLGDTAIKSPFGAYHIYSDHTPTYARAIPGTPIKVDNIIIITDEQQNSGSPVVNLFKEYRRRVNPKAKLFIIDVAPYEGHLSPGNEPGVHFIFGWSDDILRYISSAAKGFGSQVDHINKADLKQLLFS